MAEPMALPIEAAPGREWIQRANRRDIRATELRHVRMVIGGRKPRELEIASLRQTEGEISRTLFCVLRPWQFANTNYVMTEHRGRIEPFRLQLYLPFVRGTLRELPSERRCDSLLGSDFAYDDMRTWLYEEGHEIGEPRFSGGRIAVRCRCVEGTDLVRHGAAPFDVWLRPEDAFVCGIDFYDSQGGRPVRQYRAEDVTVVDGVAIPQRMTMGDRLRGHSTRLELLRAWYGRPVPPEVFDAPFRRRTLDYLKTL